MTAPDLLLRELLPLLRQFCTGPYGIALGGSHAKESGDALSDIDVYLFAHQVLPRLHRRNLLVEALGEASEAIAWGEDNPFIQGGTDFWYQGYRVECWLRNTQQVESTIIACKQGEIRREYVAWAVMGFFNYVVLADVHTMRIVEDPHGVLARWEEHVRMYPEALRQAILQQFLREAAFWPENLHYRSAVERTDIIYTSAIVQQVLHALVQVLFAFNREYFPGEKNLISALERLPTQPEAFPQRLQALLSVRGDPDAVRLREQRRDLSTLVADVEKLILA